MSILSQYHFKGRQEQAATDSNPAIAITAGAGAGKTLTLVGRYLHLLEQGYPMRSILAITFTEKAAREMRSRIRAAVSSLPTGEGPGVRESIDSARIGTIHSLCAEILRAHPAEAGLDPAFEVLEEGLAAAFQVKAVDAALAWSATDPQSAALFGGFTESELRQVLTTLLERRLDFSLPSGDELGMREKYASALNAYLSEHLDSPAWTNAFTNLAAHHAVSPEDKLELARQDVLNCWDEVQTALAAQDWDTALSTLAALRKAIDTRGGRKDAWEEANLTAVRQNMSDLKEIYEEKLKFLAEKAHFTLDGQLAALLPCLRCLLDQTLLEYQRRKDERQALDFDDLEGRTTQLLVGHSEIRSRLQSELRALLVDEFQDTNDRQRQIVYALTGFSPSPIETTLMEEGRGGGCVDLFLVGDSKQSIYRFRGADVSVFRQVQADIKSTGGITIDLDLTFRAHKPLLESLNAMLAPILGEKDDPARPYAIPFTPLRAFRQIPVRESIQPPFVEFQLGLGGDAGEGRAAAAQALANRLRELHQKEGFAWGDMALLFRASTAFTVYESTLETAGIPFVTVAGRGFYDRPEIRDLLNILAAIADPADELALVGLLRSPAFAVPDTEIYHLRINYHSNAHENRKENQKDFISVLSALRSSGTPSHQRAAFILDELHALAGRASAASVLKRLLDLTGYRAILASVPNGSRMLRNVEKLLDDAHRSRLVSLPDFLAYIQTLRDVGFREGEAPADSAVSGAVQLMTIHKAKGLEFPLVVLADASYEHRGASSKVQVAPGNLLIDLKDGDFHSVAWQLFMRTDNDRADAEDRRLLYVAATRAKEKLIVNGHIKRKKDGTLSLAGWLEEFGLDQLQIPDEMSAPQRFLLENGLVTVIYPLSHADILSTSQPVSVLTNAPLLSDEEPGVRFLLDPISPVALATDEKSRARESDPPQRIWRVVSKVKRPQAPAWVVGRLVHEALRRWRFPDDGFEAFLRPFALEAGLTDQAEIHAAIQEAGRLLERFRSHPIYAEIDSAECRHEVPYFLPEGRGIIDLLYRTAAGWVIIDFKTDEVRSKLEARTVIRENGYDQQVARYARAVTDQLNIQAKRRLVFLNANNGLAIFDL
ncbi:MAG: UvrD-helicase domain-containing protein [Anaerolineales bacterium]